MKKSLPRCGYCKRSQEGTVFSHWFNFNLWIILSNKTKYIDISAKLFIYFRILEVTVHWCSSRFWTSKSQGWTFRIPHREPDKIGFWVVRSQAVPNGVEKLWDSSLKSSKQQLLNPYFKSTPSRNPYSGGESYHPAVLKT